MSAVPNLLRRILERHPANCQCEVHRFLVSNAERQATAALPRWRQRAADAQIPGNVPHLAEGTEDFEGGVALVGEDGPELVELPAGTSVRPLPRWVQRLVKRKDKVRVE